MYAKTYQHDKCLGFLKDLFNESVDTSIPEEDADKLTSANIFYNFK